MQTTSALYKSIFADPAHVVEWKVTVNGTDYAGRRIAPGGAPKIDRSLLDGNGPSVGSCIAARLTCSIIEASSAVPRMAAVTVSYRLVLPLPESAGSNEQPTVSEWISLGTFYIDTRDVDAATGALILSCYDRMLVGSGAGGATYADLTGFDEWPQTQAAVATEIATIMGLTVDARTVIGSGDGYMVDYPNDLSMLEVLGYIGAANAGNWTITPANALRLVPLTGGSDNFTLGAAVMDLRTAPALSAWSGVTVYISDEQAFDAGADTGRVLTCDCPWATQATANGILAAISGTAYQPFTADGAVIDLALELGDVVTSGREGETVTGPVFTLNVSASGIERATVSAPGEDEIDHEYPYASYVDRSLKRKVGLGVAYEGVSISRQYGLQILGINEQGEATNRALLNSRHFSMDVAKGGTWEQQFYFDPTRRAYVFNGALGADAIYADMGEIAELTVDELSTSRRIKLYILQDTSDDNYIHIKGRYIRWITGSVIPTAGLRSESNEQITTEADAPLLLETSNGYEAEQATNRYGDPLYWQAEPVGHTQSGYPLDDNGNRIYATTDETDWPVMVYRYDEQIKAEFAFDQIGNNYIPQIILGAGDEHGNSRGYLYKDETQLHMRYVTSQGENADIVFNDDGFVDADHRRLESCTIDRGNGRITYQVEGDETQYTMTFTESANGLTFLWPDGFSCSVNLTGSGGT